MSEAFFQLAEFSRENPSSIDFLYSLMIERLDDYCDECERDRMTCVLTPKCKRKNLLDIRMKLSIEREKIPKFCYGQSKANFKRYLAGKNTVYVPWDSLMYTEDLLALLFSSKEDTIKYDGELNHDLFKSLIEKNKANGLEISANLTLFKEITKHQNLIRAGTFFWEWVQPYGFIEYNDIYILINAEDGLSTCNIKKSRYCLN